MPKRPFNRRAEEELEALVKEWRDDSKRAKTATTITPRKPSDWQNLIEQPVRYGKVVRHTTCSARVYR